MIRHHLGMIGIQHLSIPLDSIELKYAGYRPTVVRLLLITGNIAYRIHRNMEPRAPLVQNRFALAV